jgi:hypothetical protein
MISVEWRRSNELFRLTAANTCCDIVAVATIRIAAVATTTTAITMG